MKLKPHNLFTIAAAIAAGVAWHGCDSGLAGSGSSDNFGETGRTSAGEFKLISAEPVAFAGKGDPAQFELLYDCGFEVFASGGSPEWATKQIGWHRSTGDPDSVQTVENENTGEMVLALQPSSSATTLQQTTADLGPLRENAWLVATMRSKADVPYTLGIALGFPGRGDQLDLAEGHPGDGQWHDVALRVPVPSGLRQNQFKCIVVHRKDAATPALVESVHLRVEYSDVSATTNNLALNGGFESYTFTTPPYPWKVDHWNSSRLPVVGGDALLVLAEGSAKGRFAMSLTRPNEFSVVRISQPVLKPSQTNAGAKLVAKATGLASNNQELWIQLRAEKGGRDVPNPRSYAIHPGDGQWHEFATEITVPPPNVADTIYVDVFRRSFSDNKVLVDSVSVVRAK